jgi:hypothetical protein
MAKHLIIPDVQAKDGVPLDHLRWVGQYVVDKKPDVLVCIGDFADMPSLSSYDVGKKSFEGRRYKQDIEASHHAMGTLLHPLHTFNKQAKKNKEKQYHPRMVLTLGNHEERINRAVDDDPKLDGTISIDDLGYKEYGWEVYPYLEPVVIDGVAYCLHPDHKVLTTDLRYIPLRDMKVGDKLIGFDEQPGGQREPRQYRTATVEKHDLDYAPLFSVKLSDGKEFKVTKEHQWFVHNGSTYVWKETSQLRVGYDTIPKLFDEWAQIEDRDAGWLAGIFDGEGYISKPNSKQGGLQIGFGQNEGLVLEKTTSYLKHYGYEPLQYNGRKCRMVKIGGPSNDKLKFLGQIRPERLIQKFKPEMLGRLQKRDNYSSPHIVSITPIGEGEIVKIQTSTKTMIVEGFPHHNCHFFTTGIMGRPVTSAAALLNKKHQSCVMGHVQGRQIAFATRADGKQMTGIFVGGCYQHDEDYLKWQGNAQTWRGVWMLHEVNDGAFDEMPVSLNYLKRKYE